VLTLLSYSDRKV